MLIIKASEKTPSAIIRVYMMSSALKLFAYILIIVIFMLYDKVSGKAFALGFLAHYFLFSAFELISLIRFFKR